MSADWALYDEDARTWTIRGGVRGRMGVKNGTLEVSGQRCFHDMDGGKGWLEGRDAAERVVWRQLDLEGAEVDRGSARRLEWDQTPGTVRVLGGVRIASPRGEAVADTALYDHGQRSLRLDGGRPVLTSRERRWSAAVQAERVTAWEDPPCPGPESPSTESPCVEERPSRILAQGGARGWIHFQERGRLRGRGSSRQGR